MLSSVEDPEKVLAQAVEDRSTALLLLLLLVCLVVVVVVEVVSWSLLLLLMEDRGHGRVPGWD